MLSRSRTFYIWSIPLSGSLCLQFLPWPYKIQTSHILKLKGTVKNYLCLRNVKVIYKGQGQLCYSWPTRGISDLQTYLVDSVIFMPKVDLLTRIPFFLLDENECLTMNLCANGATCINTDGSYRCRCPPGFEGPLCGKGMKITLYPNLWLLNKVRSSKGGRKLLMIYCIGNICVFN